jgi:large subunit ribosomal protein L24
MKNIFNISVKKTTYKTSLKKNDKVLVISGKDNGKSGKILRILSDRNKALVEGVNIVKKHQKPTPTSSGGIVEKEAPIELSNLLIVCPKCAEGTRISKKVLEDGSKIRICKKCGEEIPEENK